MALRITMVEAQRRFRERLSQVKQAGRVSVKLAEIIGYHLAALADALVTTTPTTTTIATAPGRSAAVPASAVAADAAATASPAVPPVIAADAGFQRKCALLRHMLTSGLRPDKLVIVIVALNFDDVSRMTDDALTALFQRIMKVLGLTKCPPLADFASRCVRM
jgi:hypothetical protein